MLGFLSTTVQLWAVEGRIIYNFDLTEASFFFFFFWFLFYEGIFLVFGFHNCS